MYSFTCGGYNLVLSFDKDEGSFNFKTSDKRGKYEGSSYLKPLGCGGFDGVVEYFEAYKEKISIDIIDKDLVLTVKFFGQNIVSKLVFYKYTEEDIIYNLQKKVDVLEDELIKLTRTLNLNLITKMSANNGEVIEDIYLKELPRMTILKTSPYLKFSDDKLKSEFVRSFREFIEHVVKYITVGPINMIFNNVRAGVDLLDCKDDDSFLREFTKGVGQSNVAGKAGEFYKVAHVNNSLDQKIYYYIYTILDAIPLNNYQLFKRFAKDSTNSYNTYMFLEMPKEVVYVDKNYEGDMVCKSITSADGKDEFFKFYYNFN